MIPITSSSSRSSTKPSSGTTILGFFANMESLKANTSRTIAVRFLSGEGKGGVLDHECVAPFFGKLSHLKSYEILDAIHTQKTAGLLSSDGAVVRITHEGMAFAQKQGFAVGQSCRPSLAEVRAAVAVANAARAAQADMIGLSEGQREVLRGVLRGKNTFYTGCAGTGKSFLLRRLVDALRRQGRNVTVTAPTALAACAVNGQTLHAFSGVGLGRAPIEKMRQRLTNAARQRWMSTDVLVVDEISMVSSGLLEQVDAAAKECRGSDRPFGGVQIVFCGDFFQLPPVSTSQKSDQDRPCFHSIQWNKAVQETVVLKHVYRQRDPVFIRALNEIRVGKPSERVDEMVRACSIDGAGDISPRGVQLFAKNAPADGVNYGHLSRLAGRAIAYDASDDATSDALRAQIERGCLASSRIVLKRGASVLLLANVSKERGLVNGLRGTVVGFAWRASDPKWMLEAEKDKYTPSSGRPGFVYDRSQEPPPLEFPLRIPPRPLVEFEFSDGSKRVEEVAPFVFRVEDPRNPDMYASRTQMPLALGWAISIHKSQGMTIPRLCAHLDGTFEFGQVYVALSRATDRQGLQITGYHPNHVKARSE